MCPGALLGAVRSLVGEGDPAVAVPAALSTLSNIQRDAGEQLGEYPDGQEPERGTACYSCGVIRWPSGGTCPGCRTSGGLGLPGLSEAQVAWLVGFCRILSRYPNLFELARSGGYVSWALFQAAHAWLRHVRRRLQRWRADCQPSVPLLTATGVVCIWRRGPSGSHATLPSVPLGDVWWYQEVPEGCQLVRLRGPAAPPSETPLLLSTGCECCGKPSLYRATLDHPPLYDWEHPSPGWLKPPFCWRAPQGCVSLRPWPPDPVSRWGRLPWLGLCLRLTCIPGRASHRAPSHVQRLPGTHLLGRISSRGSRRSWLLRVTPRLRP